MTSNPRSTPLPPDRRVSLMEILAVAAIALVCATGQAVLDRQPLFWDEYYHLLAARSWAGDGTLTLGDGVYERQAWFSVVIGWTFRTFGEGVAQARMLPALGQVVWVATVFAWLRRETGRTSAWIAALLLATSPLVLVNSVMVRFYGVNGVLVTLSAVALYAGSDPGRPWPRRLGILAAALFTAWLSYRISPLTRIWVSGLIVWSAVVVAWWAARSDRRVLLLGSMTLLGAAVTGFLWSTGWFAETWEVYRSAPAWADGRAGSPDWYAELLRNEYPTFLTLFPIAALLASIRNPRLGGLCATTFLVGFVLLSGAAPKSERYLLPLMSFFFVVWGIAAAELLPMLLAWSRRLLDAALAGSVLTWPRKVLPAALVVATLLFVVVTNAGFTRARMWFQGGLGSLDRGSVGTAVSPREWNALAPDLRALMDGVDAVVTPNSLQVLYHVGDFDYAMRPTVVAEASPPEEFGVDPRDGRPVISTLESLKTVMTRHDTGLVFGDRWRWGSASEGFTPDVAEYIVEQMEPVSMPGSAGLIAYRWGPTSEPAAPPQVP